MRRYVSAAATLLACLLPHKSEAWVHGSSAVIVKSLVSDFGAHCNGDAVIHTATLSITSGTKNLSASTLQWSSADVGKAIAVSGAGSSGVLNTTISAFTDASHIVLHDNASTTLSASSQIVGWGTDDSPALQAFNVFGIANQGTSQLILDFPTSGTCQWLNVVTSTAALNFNSFAVGLFNLKVRGHNSTLTNWGNATNGNGLWPVFFLGSGGVFFDNLHDGRINTVSSGSSSVTLTNSGTPCAPSCQSVFSIGTYALTAGVDQQGFGDPPNPFFYEYKLISGISGANITFDSPLVHEYKSTWPLWNAGSSFTSDQGGPGTLYALNPLWNASFEYDDLTIDQVAQTLSAGRNVTFNNVTFAGTSCFAPSQIYSLSFIGVSASTCSNGGSGMELDKLVHNVTINGGTYYGFFSQSGSVDTLSISNATITNVIEGTPKNFIGNNVTIAQLKIGTTSYGRSDSFNCTNCAIASFVNGGVSTAHISSTYTMSGGVISSSAGNPQPWAIPGTNVFWTGAFQAQSIFQVPDIAQSGTTELTTTSLAGGFPTLPLSGSSDLGVYVHPSPNFTCSGCTGDPVLVSLSNAPANAPLYSYQKYTYTGALGSTVQSPFSMWGNLGSVSINVTNSYSGTGSLSFCLSEFNNWSVIKSDGSQTNLGMCVNAKVAGNRVMTLTGTTCNGTAGTCDAGDTGWTVPDATKTWFAGTSNSGPQYLSDVSASCPGAACPSITVTMQTNQGVM